jgi:phosphate transport system substrate-binding protein
LLLAGEPFVHLLPVLIPLIAAFAGMAGAIYGGLRILRPGRIFRPRRMVNYRVHYDDWLGTRADMKGVGELVVRRHGQDVPDASLVMVRLSNEGGLDIGKEHWVMPVNFMFDGRDVVGVEVSEPGGAPPGPIADSDSIRISKGREALELPRIELRKKDRIRLLVLLSGQRERAGPAVQGDAYIKDAVRGGGLVREVSPGRERFYVFALTGFALLSLVVAVVVALLVRPLSSTAPASFCVPGQITAAGSTAFTPTLTAVAQQFMQACPSSHVAVSPSGSALGSLGAASDLEGRGADPGIAATNLVMSDGQVPGGYPNLVGHPIAIVIFSVVVNRATGIDTLNQKQLAGIWSGRYTNWNQLGGPDMTIDIVGRNTASGTRQTFDHKILQAQTELPASSANCQTIDLILTATYVRCEKDSTGQLLQAVNEVKGAIGYAGAAEAARYPNIDEIHLDGRDAVSSAVNSGEYKFWAVEYLYTYGTPPAGSLLSAFLGYMRSASAASILQSPDWADIPCSLTALCSS